ncbi:MarR family winged helix-turn-helix transcriptional regulator [Rhizobium rhizogenes]|uniref:MarR family winged helix-turn-helix transcriptional regulator n=1 Tax=Rhizobium rhizogenes TaxID=359 RepID=UPI0022C5E1EC|nr:MarR family winged helix-turn-helix transcriptional regulator [Rhizobium rhizogenes]MCZ7484024.1 MarR family winged helix-turn-helix transcriptional regulator [Rhizobium rhizogenes]
MTNELTIDGSERPVCNADVSFSQMSGLYNRPGFKIRRAHQTAVAIFAAETSELGITSTQFGILFALASVADLDQAGMARLVGLDRSTTGLVVDLLERRELLHRVMHEEDRRRRVLNLSAKGRALFERSLEPAATAVKSLLGDADQSEVSRFTDIMEHLVTEHLGRGELDTEGPLRDLYSRPGYLIRRSHQLSSGIFVRECEAFNVTTTQCRYVGTRGTFPLASQFWDDGDAHEQGSARDTAQATHSAAC